MMRRLLSLPMISENESRTCVDAESETPTTPAEVPAAEVEGDAAPDSVADSTEEESAEERLQLLQAQLEVLRGEHETVRDQYLRNAAEFDNFRTRSRREQQDLRLQLTCSTLAEILPVVDNFERARQQLNPQGDEAQALHKSYQGLYKQLVDVLKRLGVSPMQVVGEPFDPSLHEAVLRDPSDTYHEGLVIEELQRGYHLQGRVLRHAMVKVSMGPGPGQEEQDTAEALADEPGEDSQQ